MNGMDTKYYASSAGGRIHPWPVFAAVISWALASVLVYQMLSGNFDQRSCQTLCVQMIALAALAAPIFGLALFPSAHHKRSFITALCQLSMLGLLAIYLTTYFIGTVFG